MSVPHQIQEAADKAEAFYSKPSEEVEVKDEAKEVEEAKVEQPTQENWKLRFTNYKKATDNTIYELRQTVRSLEPLKTANENLKAEVAALKEKVPSLPNEALEVFSEEELTTVDKMLDSRTSEMKEELESLRRDREAAAKREQEAEAQSEHAKLVRVITEAIPDFNEIDHDPKFHEYLNDVNEYGQIRMDLLRKAQASRDVERIIRFYSDFKGGHIGETPTQKELQQQPQSVSMTPQVQPAGIVWTDSAVQQFYKDKIQGKIPKEEADRLEFEMQQYLLTHRRAG